MAAGEKEASAALPIRASRRGREFPGPSSGARRANGKTTVKDDWCDLLCIDAPRAQAIRQTLVGVEEAAQDAAERARAFSDPTRLALASALMGCEELCVCDLAWISGRTQALVSHHLRVLRSAGQVGSRRDGKLVMYSLTDSGRALLELLSREDRGSTPEARPEHPARADESGS
ncbi:MAG: ArsR/SmtB family transcription factor [Rubrobacteraceae bacterium]